MKILVHIILLYILVCAGCSMLLAQPENESKKEMLPKWKVYHKKNSSLPGNQVTSIAQDETGRLWFGVSGRLVLYDGVEWKNYHNPSGWNKSGIITAIKPTISGSLWLSHSEKGIAKFEEGAWILYTLKKGIPDENINDLAVDRDGFIWLATKNKGLVKYDDLTWTVYERDSTPIPSSMITAVASDNSGNVWAGTGAGIVRFNRDSVWEIFTDGVPQNVSDIYVDKEQKLWLGNRSFNDNTDAIVAFNNKPVLTFSRKYHPLPSTNVSSIHADKNGKVWISCRNTATDNFVSEVTNFVKGGIAMYDGRYWNDLSAGFGKYLQTLDQSHLSPTGFETTNDFMQKCYNVNVIYIDNKNNKWLGTDNGLFVYNEKGIEF